MVSSLFFEHQFLEISMLKISLKSNVHEVRNKTTIFTCISRAEVHKFMCPQNCIFKIHNNLSDANEYS